MVKFSILRAEPADSDIITRISMEAFQHDAFQKAMLPPDMSAEQNEEWIQYQITALTRNFDTNNRQYYKAVDETTGEILGISAWQGPTEETVGEQSNPPPAWINNEIRAEIGRAFKSGMQKYIGDRKDLWCVQRMVVRPQYQGQGIGSALVRHGLELVDKDQLDCYLGGAPTAVSFYKNHGFEVKEPIYLDGGFHVTTAMFRPAKKT